MAIVGGITLGIYQIPPVPKRLFPIYSTNGDIIYPEFAYPYRKMITSTPVSAIVSSAIPIAVFIIMQLRVRSCWDLHNAIHGLSMSVLTGTIFQLIIKVLIGGLRPHFYAACKPDFSQINQGGGQGFDGVMFDRSICTETDQKKINEALMSFPSGHTNAAFAGFVFLYLYLNAKLKLWSNHEPCYWKLLVTYLPLLAATLLAGSLTIDMYHNWYDIVAGAIIGTIMAFSAYRMVYASIWDFRFNHIPLTRHVPFQYSDHLGPYEGFRHDLWTRKAGWGDEHAGRAGAPFHALGSDGTAESHSSRFPAPNMDGGGGLVLVGGGHDTGHVLLAPVSPLAYRPPRGAENMV